MIAELIAAHQGRAGTAAIEERLFGSPEPSVIAELLEQFCLRELGSGTAGCRFYESHFGCVAGLELDDGRAVAVKLHDLTADRAYLEAVKQVQRALESQGFPCPRPILKPTPMGRGLCTVENILDEGEYRAAEEQERRAMAGLLAWLVREAEPLPALEQPYFGTDALWPRTHPDFNVGTEGNEWIDAFAAEAKSRLGSPGGPCVVGHMDWSVKQFRFLDDRVTAVYDWDSLCLLPEAQAVAAAAISHRITWFLKTRVAATPDEVRAFIGDYERARGASFTEAERPVLAAQAAFSAARSARWEAYLFPDSPFVPGGFREAVQEFGEEYLAL